MSARSASRNAAPLDYVTRRNLPVSDLPARILLWIGVGCWLLHLAAGVGALLGFYLTFADSFVLIGGLALVGGGIAAVTAWILVLVAYRVMDQVEKGARERLRRKAKTVIVGTALNFPIAALCAAAFLWLVFNFLSVTVA